MGIYTEFFILGIGSLGRPREICILSYNCSLTKKIKLVRFISLYRTSGKKRRILYGQSVSAVLHKCYTMSILEFIPVKVS
jgi:hypothetical protein